VLFVSAQSCLTSHPMKDAGHHREVYWRNMRQRRRRRYNVYRLWDHEAPPPPVVGGVANIGRVTVIHRAGAIYRGIYRAYREDISRIYRCRGRDALLLLGRGRGAPLLLGRGRGALLLLGRGRGAREGGLGRVGAAGDAVLWPELGEVGAVRPGQLAAPVSLGELRTVSGAGAQCNVLLLSVTYCKVL